jgi:pimeloyl-ACP methyl ester carboxylesterase
MHAKDSERMLNFTDVSDDVVRTIRMPTLILMGDRDIPTTEHAVELSHMIPESRILIVPGGHGDFLGEAVMTSGQSRSPELIAGLIEQFLDLP